ncbi:MAG TPA: hypothetical protein VKZ91_08375 [Woeseiaceae bacterium]|nr:hypothetical protein [Woeseiaceae bacterium]
MSGNLDWKWIGFGVLIMLGLSIAAGILMGLFLMPDIQEATQMEDIALSGGQVAALAIGNFLVFLLGGFIVGLKSTGRTILEPGISAAIAVVIALILAGSFTFGSLIAGGLVPFLAGVLGGWIGERRQESSTRT